LKERKGFSLTKTQERGISKKKREKKHRLSLGKKGRGFNGNQSRCQKKRHPSWSVGKKRATVFFLGGKGGFERSQWNAADQRRRSGTHPGKERILKGEKKNDRLPLLERKGITNRDEKEEIPYSKKRQEDSEGGKTPPWEEEDPLRKRNTNQRATCCKKVPY